PSRGDDEAQQRDREHELEQCHAGLRSASWAHGGGSALVDALSSIRRYRRTHASLQRNSIQSWGRPPASVVGAPSRCATTTGRDGASFQESRTSTPSAIRATVASSRITSSANAPSSLDSTVTTGGTLARVASPTTGSAATVIAESSAIATTTSSSVNPAWQRLIAG